MYLSNGDSYGPPVTYVVDLVFLSVDLPVPPTQRIITALKISLPSGLDYTWNQDAEIDFNVLFSNYLKMFCSDFNSD